jgi:hypothetical protein
MNRKKTHGHPAASNRQSSPEHRQSTQTDASKRDSGLPGGGAGRRDVVEPIPDNIHVDPYITEGSPGYEESGSSEMRPVERLAPGQPKAVAQSHSKRP